MRLTPTPPTELTHPPKVVVEVSPKGVVASFLEGRNPKTLAAYRKDLSDFRAFLGLGSAEEAAAFLLSQEPGHAQALARSYRAHLVERKLSSATINRRLAALRSLFKLAQVVGLVSFPLVVEGVRDEPYRDTRGPGREGVKRLLLALKGRQDTKAVRDRALLRLLYDLALRRGEVLGLRVEHLDLAQKTVSVLGKGCHGRQLLTLPSPTRDALRAWLKVRGSEPGPLFLRVEKNGGLREGLSETGLYFIIHDLGKQVGLSLRPHGLRHAAITDALDATGGNVRAVQRFSRHKDLRVLVVYDDARQDLAGEVAGLVAKRTS
jgi:integrase/recombinase XerC